jgi:hypothetical protein
MMTLFDLAARRGGIASSSGKEDRRFEYRDGISFILET